MNSMEAVGAPASCVILIAMVRLFSHSLVRGPFLTLAYSCGERLPRLRDPPLRATRQGRQGREMHGAGCRARAIGRQLDCGVILDTDGRLGWRRRDRFARRGLRGRI